MFIPTGIMVILAIVLTGVAYAKGQHPYGMKLAFGMTLEILPLLIFAFIVAGMVQVLLPGEALAKWIGETSGMRGIWIGTVAGALAPGGPYVSLPIAAGLIRSGAGAGTMVAFLTGWSLWAVNRLPMEVGILGWRLTLIRFLSVLIFPPLAGVFAQFLAKVIT
ncbi:MAG: permease [Candidatus Omnitrophica bacterium]|nr:permease [Candidatus Omnitrophota bacterium]